MTRFQLNKAMFFVLAITMLSMQWSTAHIHLAEQHDHDGSYHQHKANPHSHTSFTDDSFLDSTHEQGKQKANIVELENDCNIHKWNNIDQAVVLTLVNLQLNLAPLTTNLYTTQSNKSKQRYIDYATIKLRAPPQIA